MKSPPKVTAPTAPTAPTFSQYVELLREDRSVNGGLGSSGFQALLAVRTGQLARSIGNPVVRKAVSLAYRVLRRRALHRFGIEVHRTMHIGRGVRVFHQGAIVLHPYAVIGDGCMIRQAVTLGVAADHFTAEEFPTLGRDVNLGAGAVLIGRLLIGDRARIGPNAVVMTDVPEDSLVVAPQSRVIPR